MKNNNLIKKAYSDIYISKDLEETILNMTVNQKKMKRKIPRYLVAGISVFILATTIVYADEIKQWVESWSSSIKFEDGTEVKITENNAFKKIPVTAKKTGELEPAISMTHEEIESMLGFSILKSEKATSNEIGYRTELNKNGSIGRVDLWWARFFGENDKSISISISMLNEKADKGYILAFQEGLDATGGKELENSYTSNKLGVNVLIYSNDWSNNRLTATFCYDNVLYDLIGKNISEQEMKDIIETLEF